MLETPRAVAAALAQLFHIPERDAILYTTLVPCRDLQMLCTMTQRWLHALRQAYSILVLHVRSAAELEAAYEHFEATARCGVQDLTQFVYAHGLCSHTAMVYMVLDFPPQEEVLDALAEALASSDSEHQDAYRDKLKYVFGFLWSELTRLLWTVGDGLGMSVTLGSDASWPDAAVAAAERFRVVPCPLDVEDVTLAEDAKEAPSVEDPAQATMVDVECLQMQHVGHYHSGDGWITVARRDKAKTWTVWLLPTPEAMARAKADVALATDEYVKAAEDAAQAAWDAVTVATIRSHNLVAQARLMNSVRRMLAAMSE